MFGPVVCFSCNTRLSPLSERVSALRRQGVSMSDALDACKLDPVTSMCCRRMLMCCVDSFHVLHEHDDRTHDYVHIESFRHSAVERKLPCM